MSKKKTKGGTELIIILLIRPLSFSYRLVADYYLIIKIVRLSVLL